MGALVQRVVVEPDAKPAPLLPMHVSLGEATTSKAGLVRMASAVGQVSEGDAAQAAGDAPTKEEFDAVVALVNSLKAKFNQLISAETSAGQMGQ